MAIFSQRPRGYKCGMILVLVAFKLALFGVIAPGWWAQDMLLGSRSFRGLWLACSYVYSDCVVMDFSTFSTRKFWIYLFSLRIRYDAVSFNFNCLHALTSTPTVVPGISTPSGHVSSEWSLYIYLFIFPLRFDAVNCLFSRLFRLWWQGFQHLQYT